MDYIKQKTMFIISILLGYYPFFIALLLYTIAFFMVVKKDEPLLNENHYIKFEDQYYNLKNFKHPGGNDIIKTFSERDLTLLIHSYHFNINNVKTLLKKYLVTDPNELITAKIITKPNELSVSFKNFESTEYDKLKKNVKDTLKGNVRMDYWMGLKFIVFFMLYLISWNNAIMSSSITKSILWIIIGAISHNMVDLNVTHDGSHYALSKNKYIKQLGLYMGYIMGGPVAFFWLYGHILYHHTLTGIEDLDPELQLLHPILRTYKYQKRYWFHKFQHIYAWPIYLHVGLGLVMGDMVSLIGSEITSLMTTARKNGSLTLKLPQSSDETMFYIFTKIMFMTLWIIVPIIKYRSLWGILVFYLLVVLTSIMIMGQFGIGHVVDDNAENNEMGTKTISNQDNGKFENIDDWVNHQIKHTADFNSENSLVTNLTGGINNQILHHLFPGVAHRCFSQIISIVKDYCKTKNIPYNDKPFVEQWKMHYKRLQRLGRSE